MTLTTHQRLYRDEMQVAVDNATARPNRPLIELAVGFVNVAYRIGSIGCERRHELLDQLGCPKAVEHRNAWLLIDQPNGGYPP